MYSLLFMITKYHSCLLYISAHPGSMIMLKKQNTSAAETTGADTFRKHSVPNPLALVSLRSAWDKNQASHWLLWSWSQGSSNKSFEMRNHTTIHGIGWKKFSKQYWNWEGSKCWQCSYPCLTINPCSAAATDWRQGHASLEQRSQVSLQRGGLYWMVIPEKVHKYSELTEYNWNNWRIRMNHSKM